MEDTKFNMPVCRYKHKGSQCSRRAVIKEDKFYKYLCGYCYLKAYKKGV